MVQIRSCTINRCRPKGVLGISGSQSSLRPRALLKALASSSSALRHSPAHSTRLSAVHYSAPWNGEKYNALPQFIATAKEKMSRPFQPISDVIDTSPKKGQLDSTDLYDEPENLLEIEVRKITGGSASKNDARRAGPIHT